VQSFFVPYLREIYTLIKAFDCVPYGIYGLRIKFIDSMTLIWNAML